MVIVSGEVAVEVAAVVAAISDWVSKHEELIFIDLKKKMKVCLDTLVSEADAGVEADSVVAVAVVADTSANIESSKSTVKL